MIMRIIKTTFMGYLARTKGHPCTPLHVTIYVPNTERKGNA